MHRLPRDRVEAAWEEISLLGQKGATELVQRFSREQPFLMIYVFANDEELEDQRQDKPMTSLALMIWKLLAEGSSQQVSGPTIEKAEDKIIRFLERMDAGPELRETEAVARLMTDYNQAVILGFCLEVLMSGYEDAPELAPEDIGLQLITLKTVIDCLDRLP